MNALSMESIFLILSGAVLAAGILYWFWSHIQLTQKKVQLLENAVFELRGLQGVGGPGSSGLGSSGASGASSSEVPEYRDEDEGSGSAEAEAEAEAQDEGESDWVPMAGGSTPLSALDTASVPVDLQPGGRIEVPSASAEAEEKRGDKDSEFRELFIQHEARVPTPVVVSQGQGQESLESMPVKELRRLAEQRGLTGVSELRKKELLAALRNQIVSAPAPAPAPAPVAEEVVVERTLDLTEDTVILE